MPTLEERQAEMRERHAARQGRLLPITDDAPMRNLPPRVRTTAEQKRERVEIRAARMYEQDGWTVLRAGWPDLFMYRQRDDGLTELKLREVKGPGDQLRLEQRIILSLLSAAGLDVGTYYTAQKREVEAAGEPEKPFVTQLALKLFQAPPIYQKKKYETYERTPDGGYKFPADRTKAGYMVLYECPVCHTPRKRTMHEVCGPCVTKALGGRPPTKAPFNEWNNYWDRHRELTRIWTAELNGGRQ